ncbi:MAG: hypothetical protein WCI97_04965, partial [Bacteroidota bacterium]
AQDVIQSSLKNATEQYAQKKILAVQTSLNTALTEVNNVIGAQMLAALPLTAGNLSADGSGDTNGQPGSDPACSSVNITREYSDQANLSVTVNISQNLQTANNIRTAMSQTTNKVEEGTLQKIVSLGLQKAMLVWDTEANEGDIEYAKGNVFVIFTSEGFETYDAFIAAASKIDFTKALAVLGQ